jgi:CBS domain-containing protein
MRVKNLLETKENEIISLGGNNSVEDAIRLMHSKKISALMIMNDGNPSGIFTERDVVRAYIAKDGKKFREMKLNDVMTRNLIVAQPEDLVGDVLAIMLQKSIRHMPVVQNGKMVGMLSIRDVVGM